MVSDTSSMVTRGALLAALDMARCPFCVHGEEERQDPAETHSIVPRHGNTISVCSLALWKNCVLQVC
jgi:hypothetical protein